MVVLGRALEGMASTWLSAVSFLGVFWCEFMELFMAGSHFITLYEDWFERERHQQRRVDICGRRGVRCVLQPGESFSFRW